ncbi:SDR family oxidoreductase [Sphingomonas canadensis]|uniref:SDR family oxidoreductase n=1 Tax=Sphingomonas canadensis TaxID=1219257 RepID=A0ABW3HCX2_9SPHN|nr:SDR family oxidoreductase [Sphingomonas canadensis]MCW3836983.1 SDR family oxidoreductase [Sphingomonas canadensis]
MITGTAGGQGRAAALAFAREGARIVGCDMKEAQSAETVALVRAEGGEMTAMAPVDLSNEDAATGWVNDAAAVYGGIDVLYNNAALGRIGPLMGMSTASWHFTLKYELDILFFVTRAAWPHLVARGGGSIINTGSIIGSRGSDMPMAAHGAGKAGVIGLTAHMALEGGPSGIRANCISPGLIANDMFKDLLRDPNDNMHKQVRTSPLGRIGRPEDVAGLAVFLASDESSYITGTNIVVDGGQTLGIGMSFGSEPVFAAPPEPETLPAAQGEELAIETPDGTSQAWLFTPREGAGPWPAVLLYTDIMGVRPLFKAMAQRLADAGHAVLLPNLFHRLGPPVEPPLSVKNSGEFGRLLSMAGTLTKETIERDSGAWLAALAARPEAAEGPAACVGYCMSGSMAIWTAAAHPDRVNAVAVFHGGHMVMGRPDSPHNLVGESRARFYFGCAETDAFMTADHIAGLRAALEDAGRPHEIEVYPGTYHGFAIADASYHPEGGERHWRKLVEFLA